MKVGKEASFCKWAHHESEPFIVYIPNEDEKSVLRIHFENGKFEPVPGTAKEIPADFVFLAMGFTGPEQSDLISQLEVKLDDRGNIARNADFETSEEGIFVAGDAGRGQSLIVWAIAEGRSAAAAVDRYLTGETQLPSPIEPTTRQLMV